MKNFIAYLYAMVACAAFLAVAQLRAEDAPFARFSIDKDVYEQMSASQRAGLVQKTSDLLAFINDDIKTAIPDFLKEETKNLHIKISLTDKPGRDGLFVPQENGEHTIYIQLVQVYSNGIRALLAHEIYHAIHFHVNPNEAAWVREGMAQLFEFMTTNEMNGMNLYATINNPMTPLLGDYSPEQSNPAQYGHNQLYFYYMYQHCGKENFFWKMTKGEQGLKGSFLIDAILSDMKLPNGECTSFTDSAISFEVAKLHNQLQFTNGKDKMRFFVMSGDISPKATKITSQSDLKTAIESMPVLSSLKFPLKDFLNYKGECTNCTLFYAQTGFPYAVTDQEPSKTKDYSVILVKLRKN